MKMSGQVAQMRIPMEIRHSLNSPVSHHFNVNDLKISMAQSASIPKKCQNGLKPSAPTNHHGLHCGHGHSIYPL